MKLCSSTLTAAEQTVLAALGELGEATMFDLSRYTGMSYRHARQVIGVLAPAGQVVVAGSTGRNNQQLWRLPRPGEVVVPELPEPDPSEEEQAAYRRRVEVVRRVSQDAWRDESHPLLGRDLRAYLNRIDEALELEGVA